MSLYSFVVLTQFIKHIKIIPLCESSQDDTSLNHVLFLERLTSSRSHPKTERFFYLHNMR